jgi:autotransporter-associated beta strand protein
MKTYLITLFACVTAATTGFAASYSLPPDIDYDIVLSERDNYMRVDGSGVGVISGIISGTGGIIKQGGGLLRITGINTYSGGTVIPVGTIGINHAASPGTGAITLQGGALSVDSPLVLGNRLIVTDQLAGSIVGGANLTITAPQFAGAGGALHVGAGARMSVRGVTFLNNQATGGNFYGGAVNMGPIAYLDATGAKFIGNIATNRPGGAFSFGRGGTLILIDALFQDNRSGNGGVIWNDGGTNLVLGASAGKTSAFINNSYYADASQTASISFSNRNNYIANLEVTTEIGGLLDMRDRMLGNAPAANENGSTVKVTKSGLGNWRLGGNSVFSNMAAFAVNGGRFQLAPGAQLNLNYKTSGLAINDAGTLELNAGSGIFISGSVGNYFTTNSGGRLYLGGATGGEATITSPVIEFKDGAAIGYDLGAAATKLKLAGSGTLSFGNINIDINPVAAGNASNIALLDISGFVGDKSSFEIGKFTLTLRGEQIAALGNPRLQNASLAIAGDMLQTSYNYEGTATIVWTGAAGDVWDAAAVNWNGTLNPPAGGAVNQFFHGDTVVFDSVADAGSPAHRDIKIAPGGVGIAGMTIAGDGNYTFTGGQINGAGGLVHLGSGTVALNTTNAYEGGTIISATSTLVARDPNALGSGEVQVAGRLVLDIGDAGGVFPNILRGTGLMEKTGRGEVTIGGDVETEALVSEGTLRAGRENIFISSRPVKVADGGVFSLGGYSQVITNLTNDGIIDFGYPSISNVSAARSDPISLVIPAGGGFAGTGAIRMLVYLDGSGSWSDTLRIDGTVDAGARSTVHIMNASRMGAIGPDSGLTLITAPATTADDAFSLGSAQGTGFYLFQLTPELSGGGTKSWTLYNSGYSLAMGFNTASRLAWQASLDTLLQRQGELPHGPAPKAQTWARFKYRGDNVSMPAYDAMKLDTVVAQAGMDLLAGAAGDSFYWQLGLVFDYADSDMNLIAGSEGKASIYGLGLYASRVKNGVYAHLIVKGMSGDYDLNSLSNSLSTKSKGAAASLEIGKSYEFSGAARIVPQLQTDMFWQDIDSATDNEGSLYEFDSAVAWRFRAGVKLELPFTIAKQAGYSYFRASIAHTAQSDDTTTVMGNTGVENLKGTVGILDGGFQFSLCRCRCSWIYANAAWEPGNKIDSYSFSGGFKFTW